jgi:hypothetical protein
MLRVYACIHVCCVCMCICMLVCMYACMCACMYVCMHVYMHCHACVYACMYVCMYVALSLNVRLKRWSGKQGNLVWRFVKIVFGMFCWVRSVCFVGYICFVSYISLKCKRCEHDATSFCSVAYELRCHLWQFTRQGAKTGEEAKLEKKQNRGSCPIMFRPHWGSCPIILLFFFVAPKIHSERNKSKGGLRSSPPRQGRWTGICSTWLP